jgi:RimJ/RimL family protein N-acetyltransferase
MTGATVGEFDMLETARLLMRRWREADREPFARLNGDEKTLVFFPSTLTRQQSDALVDRIEARWHRGYATEAARAARDAAFGDIGLTELWSMTVVLNTPSQAVMRRIGMTEATRFEHPRVPDGSPLKPHVIYHLAGPADR